MANHIAGTCLVNLPCVCSPRMNSLLLTGGRVIDPANRLDTVADLLILNGKIAAIGKDAAPAVPALIATGSAIPAGLSWLGRWRGGRQDEHRSGCRRVGGALCGARSRWRSRS